jgi:hypothetical protein
MKTDMTTIIIGTTKNIKKNTFKDSMDNLHVRLNFILSQEKGIKHHS